MDVFDLRAIISLDSSQFQSGLNSAKGAMATVGSGIKAGLGAVAKAGAVAFGAAEVAVGKFVKDSIGAGMTFDQSMGQVQATMGATAEEMAASIGSVETIYGHFEGTLRDFAQFMGKNTKFTATESAAALNYMALAGYSVQESMEMLPNVLSLAAAGNMDLARASDMVTDTQTAFGISAERTTQMVDEMAKAASTGNTNVEQLGDAFLRIGGLAKELNGGMIKLADGTEAPVDRIQELTIAFTAMANAGVKGNEAGTHMRNMLLKLSDPTKDGTKALEEMGVAIFDTEGNMRSLRDIFGDLNNAFKTMSQEDRIGVISDLFNTRDMASAESLLASVEGQYVKIGDDILSMGTALEKYGDDIYDVNKGFEIVQSSWDEIGASILDAKDAAGQMAETQLNNLAGDVTKFKSALEGAQIAIADGINPTLRGFVQLGTQAAQALGNAFDAFDPTPYLDAEGRMTEEGARAQAEFAKNKKASIDTLFSTFTEGLGKIVELLPSALEMGGRLLSTIAQGIMDNRMEILFAGFDILESLFNGILEGMSSDGENVIVTIIGDILGVFEENYVQIIDTGAQIIFKLIEGIMGSIGELLYWGPPIIEQLANSIVENAPGLLESATEMIVQLGQGIIDSLPYIVPAVISVIETIGSSLIENLPLLLKAAADVILELSLGIAEAIPTLLPTIVEVILAIVDGLIANIDQLIDAAIAIVMALADGLIKSLPIIIEKLPEIVQKIVDALVENAPKLAVAGYEIVFKLLGAIITNLPMLLDAAIDIIISLKNGVIQYAEKLPDAAKEIINKLKEGIMSFDFGQWGRDMIDTFIKGLKETPIGGAVEGVATTIKRFIHFSKPDEGPLADFDTYAPDMMRTFAEGITANTSLISSALQNVGNIVKSGVDNFINLLKFAIEGVLNWIQTIVKTVLDIVINAIQTAINTITNIVKAFISLFQGDFKGFFNNMQNAVKSFGNGISNEFRIIFNNLGGYFKDFLGSASTWGRDLINNFVGGIRDRIGAVRDTVSSIASTVRDFIGFSEPEEGPLSNFHTFAPDMMRLFAEGIEENAGIVTDQIAKSFDFGDMITDQTINTSGMKAPVGDSFNITINANGINTEQDWNRVAEIISTRISATTNRRLVAAGAV